jgi:hypothetical protein
VHTSEIGVYDAASAAVAWITVWVMPFHCCDRLDDSDCAGVYALGSIWFVCFQCLRFVVASPSNLAQCTIALVKMYRLTAVLALISLAARLEGVRVHSRFFDAIVMETMENKLRKDCGMPCIRMFHEMVGWLEDNAETVSAGKIGPVNGSLAHANLTMVAKEPWVLALLALSQRESEKVCGMASVCPTMFFWC